MSRIYKILSHEDWATAQAAGRFEGAAIDLTDGYIHFSTAEQAASTLAKWFAGRSDLVLLTVETDDLDPAALRWEPARGGDLFPHLYVPLEIAQVIAAAPIPTADGEPSLAGLIA